MSLINVPTLELLMVHRTIYCDYFHFKIESDFLPRFNPSNESSEECSLSGMAKPTIFLMFVCVCVYLYTSLIYSLCNVIRWNCALFDLEKLTL